MYLCINLLYILNSLTYICKSHSSKKLGTKLMLWPSFFMYEAVLWRRQGKTVGEYRSLLCVHAKSLQSCPTLCNPMNFSLPGSSVHGILQEEYLSGLPFPPPGIFLTQGLNLCHLHLLHCLCQAGSLPLVPPGKPCPSLLVSYILTLPKFSNNILLS